MGRTLGIIVGVSIFGCTYFTVEQFQATQRAGSAIEIAKTYQSRGEFINCVKTLEAIPVSTETASLKINCEVNLNDQQLFEKAKNLADHERFGSAIQTAQKIPTTSSFAEPAKPYLEAWSKKLFEIASDLYPKRGMLKEATELIRIIPSSQEISQPAQDALTQWIQEWKANSPQLEKVNTAIAAKDWKTVKVEAALLTGTSPYWISRRETSTRLAEDQLTIRVETKAEQNQREFQDAWQKNCQVAETQFLQAIDQVFHEGNPVAANPDNSLCHAEIETSHP